MTANPTSEAGYDRSWPQDVDAEKCVIGAMLLSRAAIDDVQGILQPAHFHRPAHEMIYTVCAEMADNGEPVDPIAVANELGNRGLLKQTGDALYLHECMSTVPSPASAGHYARIVRDKARKRALVVAGMRIQEFGYGDGDGTEAYANALAAMEDLDSGVAVSDLVSVDKIIGDVVDHVQGLDGKPLGLDGLSTGFKDLDRTLGGLRPGQMVTIAARPAMGKSVLALDLLRACTMPSDGQEPQPAILFSLEMGREEIGTRLLAAQAGVKLQSLKVAPGPDDRDWSRLAAVVPTIQQAPMYIDDGASMTMPDIRAKARRFKSEHGLGLIVIDYLQLMSSGKRVESRQQEVSEFSRAIKLLAKELEVPVVVLSQLNRGPEQRGDKKPQVSDLRESGAIEQDSDIIILIHRPEEYDQDDRPGEADFIVGKNRNGETRTVTVVFQGHYQRFADMAAA